MPSRLKNEATSGVSQESPGRDTSLTVATISRMETTGEGMLKAREMEDSLHADRSKSVSSRGTIPSVSYSGHLVRFMSRCLSAGKAT